MLMSLGLFAFSLDTVPYETIKRSTKQRWVEKPRVGKGAAWQHLGPGEDTITVEGKLMPELTGGAKNLGKLREMMATGKAWILTAATGEIMGPWIIEGIDDSGSHFDRDGVARKTTFTLTLKHYWDENPSGLGKLMDSMP